MSNPLTAQQVEAAKPGLTPTGKVTTKPYKLADRNGLFLLVTPKGAKLWRWKFRFKGKERQASFGSFPVVKLAEARRLMEKAREQVRNGVDPIASKRAEEKPLSLTFRTVAESYIEKHSPAWKNPKHRAQWTSTLETYALPVIGDLQVAEIELAHISQILDPIWQKKSETASRVRGRIENVLDFAEAQGWRTGKNPAMWKGGLKHTLPAVSKVRRVKHFEALPWQKAPDFMTKLRNQPGMGARALEFAILTAARSGEVRGATWAEVDLEGKLWTIPAERMKASKEHRVPLSDAAMAVLREVMPEEPQPGRLVFPGQKRGKPLSDMSLSAVLRRMKLDVTPHGFRSTFRDWVAENTEYAREVAEMALAHTVGNAVEAAYRRGDLLEKRRQLMMDWANFVGAS